MSRTLSLTAEQSRAVSQDARRLLVLASAGSGKTEVLVRRIERLLMESAGQAFRILGLTYTVKTAEQLRARVKSTVAEEAWRVDCDTLHGFALQWLMRYGVAVGVGPHVVVYSDDADRVELIAEYLRTLGVDADAHRDAILNILKAIDDHRTLQPGRPVDERTLETLGVSLPELYDAYVTALDRVGGIDFPGMLVKLREALEVDPWVLENFRRTFRHVLVDEGQDLTPAQADVLQMLVGDNVDLFVVADDRQSINGYAGGSFANAKRLVGNTAEKIALRHNFRCSKRILDAAERIAASLHSPQESPVAPNAPPGDLRIEEAVNPQAEAIAVREWIENLLQNGLDPTSIVQGEDPRVNAEEIAVIARARWVLDPVVRELGSAGHKLSLNVETAGFLQTTEGRLFLEAMAVINDSADRPALRRFREEFSSVSRENGSDDPINALENSGLSELHGLAAHLTLLRNGRMQLDEGLGGLAARFAGASWSRDAEALEQLWLEYRSDVIVQQRTMKGFLRFVDRVALAKPTDPGIRILTIHRVKGLEFKAVALVGMQDGVLPDYRARSPRDVDAERRSLYVAMTRAKRALRVSWQARTLDRWNRVHQQRPCRFLTEAGLDRL
ncbi:MAG TPA: ATP-dependent helicase [Gemmatimonadaceae bacterium]